jgi:FixJ family two-component response regulator
MSGDHPGLPILFISGYTDLSIVDRGELGSGVEFLPKPFTSSALGHAVRKALGAERVVLSDT